MLRLEPKQGNFEEQNCNRPTLGAKTFLIVASPPSQERKQGKHDLNRSGVILKADSQKAKIICPMGSCRLFFFYEQVSREATFHGIGTRQVGTFRSSPEM